MEQREQASRQEIQILMPPNIPLQEFRHDMPHVRNFINVSTVDEYIRVKIAHQQAQLDSWTDKPGRLAPIGFRKKTAEQEAKRLETMLNAVNRGETRGAKAELEKDISKLERMKNEKGEELKQTSPDDKKYRELDRRILEAQKKLPDIKEDIEANQQLTETLRALEAQLDKTQRGQIERRMMVLEAGARKLTSLKEIIALKETIAAKPI